MRRLRSNITLLSDETSPAHQENSKRPLEQFSWSQILSVQPHTLQMGDSSNPQNLGVESDTRNTTNAADHRFYPDAVEHRSKHLFEQGDVVEHPRELWNEHSKGEHKHELWNEHQKGEPRRELWNEHQKEERKDEMWKEHSKGEHRRELWKEHTKDECKSEIWKENSEGEHRRELWKEHPKEEYNREFWNNYPEEEHREEEQSASSFDMFSNGSESSYISRQVREGLTEPMQTDASMTPYPVVNPHGLVSILLRHLVKVDVTPSGAVCIHNLPGNSVVTMSSSGDKTCIFHPNSRVFQDGPCVHVTTCQNRMAKICPKGVVFASSSRSLAYRVDESGTKTTADRFFDMRDVLVAMDVFCDELADCWSLERCYAMVAGTLHKSYPNGDDVWVIGDAQVRQDCYGNVEVSKNYRRHVANVLPAVGDVSVSTPRFSASVGCYSRRYLSVQMGSRKLTSGMGGLSARNGSQRAGLDRDGKVVIL